MQPSARTIARAQRRKVFREELARSGQVRTAAQAAEISESTARRWKAEFELEAISAQQTLHEPETRFIGRHADRLALRRLLAGNTRLITLIGAPGQGKTRLALRCLRDLQRNGEATLFCELRGARSLEDFHTRLGHALSVPLDCDASAIPDRLGEVLRARGKYFLALDNFEQLVPTAIETVTALVRSAPACRFLVTSRTVLGLRSERVQEVGPLRLPEPSTDEPSEAFDLFVDRARAVEPAYGPSVDDVEPSHTLVKALDGNPLAIELAASQMRRLSVPEILRELQSSLLTMASQHRDVEAGHRSLHAAIAESWRLLTGVDRAVLSQLTVFQTPFALADACAVVRISSRPDERSAVHASITRLREASLLHTAGVDPHGLSRRWDMYQAIREYAAGHLAASEERWSDVRHRHSLHFLKKGEDALRESGSATPTRSALSQQVGEYRESYRWLSQNGRDAVVAARAALVLEGAAGTMMPSIAEDALTQVLAPLDASSSTRVLMARLRLARARTGRLRGSYTRALDDLRDAREAATGHPALTAEIDCEAGTLHHFVGDPTVARSTLKRALKIVDSHEEPVLQARIHARLAWVLAEAFLDPRSFDHYAKATALLADAGTLTEETFVRMAWCVHRIFFARGDVAEELNVHVATAQSMNDRWLEALGRQAIGILYHDRGQIDEAIASYTAALQLASHLGLRHPEGHTHMWLGTAYAEAGKPDQARRSYERALAALSGLGERRTTAMCATLFAGLLARGGETERAEKLLDSAEAVAAETRARDIEEAVQLQRAHLDLARCHGCSATAHLHKTMKRMALAREGTDGSHPPFAAASAEARAMLRLLTALVPPATHASPTLRVHRDGSGFQIGNEASVTLPRGPAIRLVLAALAARRRQSPGESLTVHELLEHGWPGQTVLPGAGGERVREVLKRLRKAGLQSILLNRGDGYQLDPEVPLLVEPWVRLLPSAPTDSD